MFRVKYHNRCVKIRTEYKKFDFTNITGNKKKFEQN